MSILQQYYLDMQESAVSVEGRLAAIESQTESFSLEQTEKFIYKLIGATSNLTDMCNRMDNLYTSNRLDNSHLKMAQVTYNATLEMLNLKRVDISNEALEAISVEGFIGDVWAAIKAIFMGIVNAIKSFFKKIASWFTGKKEKIKEIKDEADDKDVGNPPEQEPLAEVLKDASSEIKSELAAVAASAAAGSLVVVESGAAMALGLGHHVADAVNTAWRKLITPSANKLTKKRFKSHNKEIDQLVDEEWSSDPKNFAGKLSEKEWKDRRKAELMEAVERTEDKATWVGPKLDKVEDTKKAQEILKPSDFTLVPKASFEKAVKENTTIVYQEGPEWQFLLNTIMVTKGYISLGDIKSVEHIDYDDLIKHGNHLFKFLGEFKKAQYNLMHIDKEIKKLFEDINHSIDSLPPDRIRETFEKFAEGNPNQKSFTKEIEVILEDFKTNVILKQLSTLHSDKRGFYQSKGCFWKKYDDWENVERDKPIGFATTEDIHGKVNVTLHRFAEAKDQYKLLDIMERIADSSTAFEHWAKFDLLGEYSKDNNFNKLMTSLNALDKIPPPPRITNRAITGNKGAKKYTSPPPDDTLNIDNIKINITRKVFNEIMVPYSQELTRIVMNANPAQYLTFTYQVCKFNNRIAPGKESLLKKIKTLFS